MPDQPLGTSRRRWLRISVRGLIILVLVIGGWLGWAVHNARIQREAVAAVERAGGEVMYDWQWQYNAPAPVMNEQRLRGEYE